MGIPAKKEQSMTISCELTIFEGPDGGGKSTAAKAYAEATNARYVHFPSLPRVTWRGLPRMYLEAMLPALHGYHNVVFDRSWLSEHPYGSVFRPNQTLRVDTAAQRILERVVMRCKARVVYCLPGLHACMETFRSRRGEEMLEREEQLEAVYRAYDAQVDYSQTHLPFCVFDRTKHNYDLYTPSESHESCRFSDGPSTAAHDLRIPTVGNRLAKVCLVGENFSERGDHDLWQQYPFTPLAAGSSHWLSYYLEASKVRENEICWANADFDLQLLDASISANHYIAFGAVAAKALDNACLNYSVVRDPKQQMREKTYDQYNLGRLIRSVIDGSMATSSEGSDVQRASG